MCKHSSLFGLSFDNEEVNDIANRNPWAGALPRCTSCFRSPRPMSTGSGQLMPYLVLIYRSSYVLAMTHIAKWGLHQGVLKGKYHCTVDLLFDWFGLVCFANKNKNCQLSYNWFQTSQTGGQRYSDASPFSIPCQWSTKISKLGSSFSVRIEEGCLIERK